MVKISQYEDFKEGEEELSVVYEDVPDEDELPPGWEDHLYEAWRDQQRDK